jgi:spermidine/putrescine transport system ATP-binding protein
MLEIRHIQKCFNSADVLKSVSLDIKQGDFYSILGPSGCGKTTLLRIIAGFETPDSGDILWNGKSIFSDPAYKRPFNIVFQRYALFPHMSVEDNVAFGPKVKKWNTNDMKHAVMDALKLVRMEDYAKRGISTLSGGQQQRIALARAIVNKPQVLLLDEPLSALDQKLREKMRIDLLRIQRSLGITFILVTHDQEEALTMSDRIAIMSNGSVEQQGTPEEIYRRPGTEFVADFIGAINSIQQDQHRYFVRPEEIQISKEPFLQNELYVEPATAHVREILFKGAVTDFIVDLNQGKSTESHVIAQVSSSWQHGLEVGQTIQVRWPKHSCLHLTRRTET